MRQQVAATAGSLHCARPSSPWLRPVTVDAAVLVWWQCERQRTACDCLLTLSSSRSLRSTIVDVLLDTVADVADRLSRTSITGDDDDDGQGGAAGLPSCWRLENVAHVLDCTEQALTRNGDRQDPAAGVELRRRLSSQLDLSLRHVAGAFPLFAYRVWQLADRLQADVDDHGDGTPPPD